MSCFEDNDQSKVPIAKIMKLFEQKKTVTTDKKNDFRSFLKTQKQQLPPKDEEVRLVTKDEVMKDER